MRQAVFRWTAANIGFMQPLENQGGPQSARKRRDRYGYIPLRRQLYHHPADRGN
jgi:hypothetical protein